MRARVAFFLAFTFQTGCFKTPLVTACSVVSFDGSSNQYTLIYKHVVDSKPAAKRLTVICSSYQWGDREVLQGPTVCKLVAGGTLKENSTLGRQFRSIYEPAPGKLAIMEGIGPNRVVQQFDILKQEVIEP